jgi:hypothetical protein
VRMSCSACAMLHESLVLTTNRQCVAPTRTRLPTTPRRWRTAFGDSHYFARHLHLSDDMVGVPGSLQARSPARAA